MELVAIRRYPVKSMGGEALTDVELDGRGLAGDRWYAVTDADGHLASGKDTRRFRRRDRVFDYAAHTEAGGVVVTAYDRRWELGPGLDAELTTTLGAAVRVQSETEVPHFDDGAVSLIGTASLAWCAERFGLHADPRRLRVNLLVATTEPFVEETWVGRSVRVGAVTLRVLDRLPRCRTIDLDQDGVRADGRWLKALGRERDACLAVYADVSAPGRIAVGDPVVAD